jgi:hypothetical protein
MSVNYRRDECVVDVMGNPISGVQIFVYTQPANINNPPSPSTVQLYADPSDDYPLSRPPQTNAYGQTFWYALPGIYTICYFSPQIQGQVFTLVDQEIIQPAYTQLPYQIDNSTAGGISGAIDGVNTVFGLTEIPAPFLALIVTVNGVIQTGFDIVGAVLTLAVAPQTGDVIQAQYPYAPDA